LEDKVFSILGILWCATFSHDFDIYFWNIFLLTRHTGKSSVNVNMKVASLISEVKTC
jgi:hypothetical protein